MRASTLVFVGIGASMFGCGDGDVENSMRSRPVTVLELFERDFAREHTLTGSVNLYREERIGFEVTGRVLSVLDQGREVRGPAFNEDGELVRRGDQIATMESTRYRRQQDALEARLDAARRDLDVTEAQVTLARQTLDRQKQVLAEGAGAQQAVDNAQSAFDQATAQFLARQATVTEVFERLERAREDFEDTTLYAPFSGRITATHVSEGAVVDAGTSVVTLTLMDPVHLQVEVSADDEREIQTGDRAIIYPKDPLQNGARIPVNAIVFEKGAVADPQLRTFRIDIIVRNQRRLLSQLDPRVAGLPVVNDWLPVVREFQGEPGPLFVPTDSVLREGGRTFVLRLPGVSFNPGAERSAVGRHIPDKVEITLGTQYTTVINWNFRSLLESGDLAEGDFLALHPTSEHAHAVAIGRPQWLLRPRDLVPVKFTLSASPPGFYVPTSAITLSDNGEAVFVVENGRAVERPVSVRETFEELRRIEGEGIAEGVLVIVGGVHYVSDDQPVTIIGREAVP